MNKPLVVIFAAIALDAVGIGLIFPILPRLLESVAHTQNTAPIIGIMIALYAVMQFIFAPVLGALSDNLGRRPVLLISLVGAAINYVAMAFAPQLWMLLLGRAIAGLTSANMSVAMAYVTDISPEDKRARRFGLFNAMFGAGFIVGPVLGGLLGDYWLRLPFIAAAALNAGNLLLALFVLPESHTPARQKIDLAALNPLRPLRWVFSMKGLVPVVLVFFILAATGEAYGTCWALWGFDAFRWNGFWIGLSLARSVLPDARAGVLARPGDQISRRTQRRSGRHRLRLRCACRDGVRQARLDRLRHHARLRARRHRHASLSGAGHPPGRSARQGQFQGVLASAVSLASIVGPLVSRHLSPRAEAMARSHLALGGCHLRNCGPAGFSRHPDGWACIAPFKTPVGGGSRRLIIAVCGS